MVNVMPTRAVIDTLRTEGFRITPSYLGYLLREHIVPSPEKFSEVLLWSANDVERLREVLRERGRWSSQWIRRAAKEQADAAR